MGGLRVDRLYRDLTLVADTIADCEAGRFASHHQPGHPHAFHTHMLMGEVFHGAALVDSDGASLVAAVTERCREG